MNTCSLVTAYYDIPSKYAVAKYIEDIMELCNVSAPIIFFTNAQNAALIRRLRGSDKKLHIIESPFEELETWKLYGKYWDMKYRNDPLIKLYALRCQKAFFMDTAARLNPFATDYFVWCDVSVLRKDLPTVVKQTFPVIKYTHKNPVFGSIIDCPSTDLGRHPDGIFGSTFDKPRISTKVWYASVDGCKLWRQIFESMLIIHLSSNRPIQDDTSIVLSAVLTNQSDVCILKSMSTSAPRENSISYLLSEYCTPDIFSVDTSYSLDIQNYPVSIVMIGGLGNQMFQLAAAYAFARKYCGRLCIQREKAGYDRRPMYWNSILERWNHLTVETLPSSPNWHETLPCKRGNPPRLTEAGLRLCTYLQTSKYFICEEIKNEIKLLMKPSKSVLTILNEKYGALLQNAHRIVVMHARRTDYCTNETQRQFHNPQDISYYRVASERVCKEVKKPYFLLCGDDNTFWTENIAGLPNVVANDFKILDEPNEVIGMALLQQFSHFIISNSTFAWWFAWLADEPKKVYVPSKWFGPTGPSDYEDIYEPEWERI